MDLTDISLKLYRYFIGLCNIFQPSPVYEVKEIRSEGGSAIMRHMRFRYKVILTTLTVFLILSLTACSASSKSASSYSAAENFAVAGGPVSQEDAKTSDIQDTITGTDTNSEDTNSTGTSLQDGDKIIYSGSVDLQTLDYSGTVGQIRKNTGDMGGFIESESEYNQNYNWYRDDSPAGLMSTTLVIRIPAEKFDTFMSSLEDLGQIMQKNSSAQNITKTYNDNETTIQVLNAEKERLADMMDKAETIQDMIAIEQRLSEVETQLNQANTTKSGMDMDIEYSTITVTVEEVSALSDIENPKDSFGSRIARAFGRSWTGFISFLQNFLLFLIRALPFLILLALLIFITVKIIRHRRKVQKNKNTSV